MTNPRVVGAASENHFRMMDALAKFLGLTEVECSEEIGSGERYVLTREDGKQITLKAGSQDREGFITIDYGQPARRLDDPAPSPSYADLYPDC